VRRYHVTTFGCQMNEHDAERIRGLLESAGLARAAPQPRFGEVHAADLDPSEVVVGERVGMDGRPLPKLKGAITGLEGGGGASGPYSDGG